MHLDSAHALYDVFILSCAEAQRRAAAFGRAFTGHIAKLRTSPHAYGELGLADLFEMREECLREFGFVDVYRRASSLGHWSNVVLALAVVAVHVVYTGEDLGTCWLPEVIFTPQA